MAGTAGGLAPLRFRGVATLPSARAGSRWGPHKVLEQGRPPYVLRFVGARPAWMDEPVGGALAGTPPKPETVVFTLEGASADDPARVVTQTYRLQVLGIARPQPPAAPPRVTEIRPEEATADSPTDRDVPITWRLDAGDVKALVKALPPGEVGESDADGIKLELRALTQVLRAALTDTSEAPQAGAASGPQGASAGVPASGVPAGSSASAPAGAASSMKLPTAKQIETMLAPLVDVDYPTESHFRIALAQSHCGQYRALMAVIANTRSKARGDGQEVQADLTCPLPVNAGATKPVGAASAAGATAAAKTGGISPAALYTSLMTTDHVKAIVAQARKPHRADPTFDASWSARPGCGCVQPRPENEVIAFVPHWGTTEQQQASPAPALAASAPPPRPPAPRETDFSVFTRLSFIGAVLNDLGDAEMPNSVSEAGQRLSHAAQRHGSRVDLVVYRNDWDELLAKPKGDRTKLAQRAAESTMRHVDATQRNLHPLAEALLLPFWRAESHAYSGVTVFFDNLPADGTRAAAAYKDFHREFVDALGTHMQERGRSYRLNIVVPDDRVADNGLYELKTMQERILRTEPSPRNPLLANENLGYAGRGDVRVNYVVILSDPTTRTKKDLRLRIDRSADVTGARRVTLLDSLVPMLLRPPAIKSSWAVDDPGQQFKDDLAYLSWTYGGAAVWEPPGQAKGDKDRLSMLQTQFGAGPPGSAGLCTWICPNRVWLRLLLQALVATGVLALGAWLMSCTLRSLGGHYKALLWTIAFLSVLVALALLNCDPALEAVSRGNAPLVVLTLAVFAVGLYWSFRGRRERP